MKKQFTFLMLAVGTLAFAQTQGKVGINTSTPAATLDINIAAANTTTSEGLLVPRVTTARAEAMGTNPAESTLVYITDGTAGTTTGTAISGKGFYYYDKATNKWTALKGSGGGTTQTWEQIRTTATGIQTITANDATIATTTWFADVSGPTTTVVRLPQATAADIGKMVTVFKSDTSNVTATDFNGVASCATCLVRGNAVVTSGRGKAWVWTGTYWAPVSY